jgi:hypothetical protein
MEISSGDNIQFQMEISSGRLHTIVDLYQEQLRKMQLYIGPLAGIEPAILVQRSITELQCPVVEL